MNINKISKLNQTFLFLSLFFQIQQFDHFFHNFQSNFLHIFFSTDSNYNIYSTQTSNYFQLCTQYHVLQYIKIALPRTTTFNLPHLLQSTPCTRFSSRHSRQIAAKPFVKTPFKVHTSIKKKTIAVLGGFVQFKSGIQITLYCPVMLSRKQIRPENEVGEGAKKCKSFGSSVNLCTTSLTFYIMHKYAYTTRSTA